MKLSASAPLALALALCALLHAPHATNAAAAELPLQITPGNIKEATAGESTVIVAFLARPAPKFESELVRLKQLTANDPSVTVAAANCAVHRRFIREYGLTIFPAIRVFPAGLNHVPFVVDFADDLVAERLQQILEHYKNAIAPLPPQYDASLEAAREYLFGAHRGNNTIQQEALRLAEAARAELERDVTPRRADEKQEFLTKAEVDYERFRFYEFVLKRAKHGGLGYIANELNRVRKQLTVAPTFIAPHARTALLVKLHILGMFENLIEFQDLDVEVDENFQVIAPGSVREEKDSSDEDTATEVAHTEL